MSKKESLQEFVVYLFLWTMAVIATAATVLWIGIIINGFLYMVRNA